jgi:phage FluMu protein Com
MIRAEEVTLLQSRQYDKMTPRLHGWAYLIECPKCRKINVYGGPGDLESMQAEIKHQIG